MSEGNEPVTFSVVGTKRRSKPGTRSPEHRDQRSEGISDAQALPEMGEVRADPLDEAFYEGNRFPLAGPIIQQATRRQLKGRCSSCEIRLRLKVKGPGPVTVRCPICGNRKEVRL